MNRMLVISILLIVVGAGLAHQVQTGGGTIDVQDIRFKGSAGNTMSALLYVPETATSDNPAPGILAVHGYINSRETQSGFAIELARRGFVVLALDQTGHGFSDAPAFAHGFGGPDGLQYLRSLPFVDQQKIGLEGHSMGGWTVQMAAAAHPYDYAAMVLEGSSTGTFGAPEGTPTSPRNLLLVFSLYDEFSGLMWDSPVPADIVHGDKLKNLFGADESVEVGRLYGDVNLGTARKLAMPAVTHPGDHHSRQAIGAAVAWFSDLLGDRNILPADNQVWYWKELGTLMGLVGIALLVFPLTSALLKMPLFAGAICKDKLPVVISRRWRMTGLVVSLVVPVLLFFPLQTIANLLLPANPVFPQQITNGVLLWAWGAGLLSSLVSFRSLRQSGSSLRELLGHGGMRPVLAAFVLAVIVVLVLYLVMYALDALLNLDFRFWVVALKRMSLDQAFMFLIYLPFFTLYFLVLSASLHLAEGKVAPMGRVMRANALLLSGSFVVLLLAQYLPLFLGGTLLIESQPLLTIVAFQFVPLLALVGCISTYAYYLTNQVFAGAFINALFVTWYMVAGTATQTVPFWQL